MSCTIIENPCLQVDLFTGFDLVTAR